MSLDKITLRFAVDSVDLCTDGPARLTADEAEGLAEVLLSAARVLRGVSGAGVTMTTGVDATGGPVR